MEYGRDDEVMTVYSDVTLGGDGLRTPDVIALTPDDIVVAWRENRDPQKFDKGAIRYAYSSDGGRSWSAPQDLARNDDASAWVYVIFYHEQGTIWAFLGRSPLAGTAGEDARLYAKTSRDGGRTWANTSLTVNHPGSIVVAGRPLKHGASYLMPFHVGLVGGVQSNAAGVLRSDDLITWNLAALVPDPQGLSLYEPQLTPSQDAPEALVMVMRTRYTDAQYRTQATYAARSASIDGGATWSPAALDPSIPNYNTKGYFATDANGRYLTIYNTFGAIYDTVDGPPTARLPLFRENLYYKFKRRDEPWGPGRFLANNPPVKPLERSGIYAGWDTYPMGFEYAAGKFYVVWEHDTSSVKLAKLDLTQTFNGVSTRWSDVREWEVAPGGGSAEPLPTGGLRLRSGGNGAASVRKSVGPSGAFTLVVRGQVAQGATLDLARGGGVSLGTRVATGTRRLMLAIQPDGVYTIEEGASEWSCVHTKPIGSATHTWRVVVTGEGEAFLYQDDAPTGARWRIQRSSAHPEVAHWVRGAGPESVEAHIEYTEVSEIIVFTDWETLGGWLAHAGDGVIEAQSPGTVYLRSKGGHAPSVTYPLRQYGDFTLEFTGQLGSFSTAAPGVAAQADGRLGITVANGAKRLMLAFQSDGVYVMRKGVSEWARVFAAANDAEPHRWKVVTHSGGEAHLYRDGRDTEAWWVMEDAPDAPSVTFWITGGEVAGETTATEARIGWTLVTAGMTLDRLQHER